MRTKIWTRFFSAAAMVCCLCCMSGCATTAMKGTPFFTGEYTTRQGLPEERVNLWPLAYYNEPALSILWPLGEVTDTHVAIRPFFSMVRDNAEAEYTEYNVLWPLAKFDAKRNQNRIFPVFWGDDYFNVFPLYWREWSDDWERNTLFPLWSYTWSRNRVSYGFLWPLIMYSRGEHETKLQVLPFFSRTENPHANEVSSRYLLGLAGADASPGANASWVFPLYGASRDEASGESSFLSLLWFQKTNDDRTTSGVPLLLSWYEADTSGSELNLVAGLFRHGEDALGKTSGHLLPLYVYNEKSFYSLPYVSTESHTSTLRLIPPLLSWQRENKETGASSVGVLGGLFYRGTRDSATTSEWLAPFYYRDNSGLFLSPLWAQKSGADGSGWYAVPLAFSWGTRSNNGRDSSFYALGGLYHHAFEDDAMTAHWLLPFYYRGAAHGIFVTPFWAHNGGAQGTLSWHAIPPILSWRYRDSATDETSLFALGGLYHRKWNAEELRREWLFPMYYRDGDGLFVSPLWAHSHDAGAQTGWSAVPPLLSWRVYDDAADTSGTFVLGGLFGAKTAGGEHDTSWLFPLYYAGDNSFYSLLYTQYETAHNKQRRIIPPLLSWQTSAPATDTTSTFVLGGLFGNESVDGKSTQNWLFPLYYADDKAFLTLLYGQRKYDRYNEFTMRYLLTPLVGYVSGDGFNTSWLFPLYYRSKTENNFDLWLLWTNYERDDDNMWNISVFPFYERSASNDPRVLGENEYSDALDKMKAANTYYDYSFSRSLFLLGFGKNEHSHRIQIVKPVMTDQKNSGCLIAARNRGLTSAIASNIKLDVADDHEIFISHYREKNRFFPLWSYNYDREIALDTDTRETLAKGSLSTGSFLLFLYDYRHETNETESHDYVRRRVLWRLYHYEKLNGDTTVDIFPAITWDRKTDGSRKTSFLWRLFRYERDADGNKKLDLLFIPILRP